MQKLSVACALLAHCLCPPRPGPGEEHDGSRPWTGWRSSTSMTNQRDPRRQGATGSGGQRRGGDLRRGRRQAPARLLRPAQGGARGAAGPDRHPRVVGAERQHPRHDPAARRRGLSGAGGRPLRRRRRGHPDAAMKLMNAVMQNPAAAQENLKHAAACLEGKGATKLGVIGWCFGGGWSLATALLMPGQDRRHGDLLRPPGDRSRASSAAIKSPVLGFFGAEDQSIPVATVQRVRERAQEARQAGGDQDLRRRRPCLRQRLGRQLPARGRQGRLAADDRLLRQAPPKGRRKIKARLRDLISVKQRAGVPRGAQQGRAVVQDDAHRHSFRGRARSGPWRGRSGGRGRRSSRGRILGAMPPPSQTPPVAVPISARLPATAP